MAWPTIERMNWKIIAACIAAIVASIAAGIITSDLQHEPTDGQWWCHGMCERTEAGCVSVVGAGQQCVLRRIAYCVAAGEPRDDMFCADTLSACQTLGRAACVGVE
jgi:uncharacterized membrane protein